MKETARGRTQEPFREERKGDEFKKKEGGRKEGRKEGIKQISVRKVHGRDGGARLEKVLFVPSRGRGWRRKKKRSAEVRYPKARQGMGRWEDVFFLFSAGTKAFKV